MFVYLKRLRIAIDVLQYLYCLGYIILGGKKVPIEQEGFLQLEALDTENVSIFFLNG